MIHSGTYNHILNEIFSDLMTAAHITIDYKGHPCASDDEDDVRDIRIHSVNGFHKPDEYYARVNFLCSELVGDLMRAQVTFQPEEKPFFMEKALERFEPLLHIVTFEQFHPRFCHRDQGVVDGLHLFTHPTFVGDKYHEAPFYLFDRILCSAWKFSYFWDAAITNAYEKLTNISTFIEYIPSQHYQVQSSQTINPKFKLRFTGTVPQLACLARFLYDNHFFNNINKSDVCRVFIDTFQTKGQDNIHWRSFKNNFDSPSADAILFWQEEFCKTMQYFQKLIKTTSA